MSMTAVINEGAEKDAVEVQFVNASDTVDETEMQLKLILWVSQRLWMQQKLCLQSGSGNPMETVIVAEAETGC